VVLPLPATAMMSPCPVPERHGRLRRLLLLPRCPSRIDRIGGCFGGFALALRSPDRLLALLLFLARDFLALLLLLADGRLATQFRNPRFRRLFRSRLYSLRRFKTGLALSRCFSRRLWSLRASFSGWCGTIRCRLASPDLRPLARACRTGAESLLIVVLALCRIAQDFVGGIDPCGKRRIDVGIHIGMDFDEQTLMRRPDFLGSGDLGDFEERIVIVLVR
jgi:hypothetical protein